MQGGAVRRRDMQYHSVVVFALTGIELGSRYTFWDPGSVDLLITCTGTYSNHSSRTTCTMYVCMYVCIRSQPLDPTSKIPLHVSIHQGAGTGNKDTEGAMVK